MFPTPGPRLPADGAGAGPIGARAPAGLRPAARRPPAPKAAAAKGGAEGADAAAGSEDSAFFAGSASFKLPQARLKPYSIPYFGALPYPL